MRDEKRIQPFLKKFEEVWKQNPDLRFGQLVDILWGDNHSESELFYLEDDEFLEALERFTEKHKGFGVVNISKEKLLSQCYFVVLNSDVAQLLDAAEVPYFVFHDLIVAIRYEISNTDDCLKSCFVDFSMLDLLDVSDWELVDRAYDNDAYYFTPLCSFAPGILFPEGYDSPLVVRSKREHNGASFILHSELMEDLAENVKCDFYIIPSSVHELIIIPVDFGLDADSIKEMIKAINSEVLSAEEKLSDSLYLWDCEKCEVTIV